MQVKQINRFIEFVQESNFLKTRINIVYNEPSRKV